MYKILMFKIIRDFLQPEVSFNEKSEGKGLNVNFLPLFSSV